MNRLIFAAACVFGAPGAVAGDIPDMVLMPAGSCQMGSLSGEAGREGGEAPRHDATLVPSLWVSDVAKSFTADHIFGPWREPGNPVRWTAEQVATTFGGQSTFVLTLHRSGCERQILMLDIWRPKDAIDGRHAWLPLEWQEDKPVMRGRVHWTLEDLDRLPCKSS